MTRLRLPLVTALLCTAPLGAQRLDSICVAPRLQEMGAVGWLAAHDGGGMAEDPSVARVRELFRGTWDVLIVTTEGASRAEARRQPFHLFPTTDTASSECPLETCTDGRSWPMVGYFGLGPLPPSDSAKLIRRRFWSWNTFELQYHRYPDGSRLVFNEIPSADGGGRYFTVAEASPTTLVGRWTDGGRVMRTVERAGVRVQEPYGGYFCAVKRPRR